MARQLPVLPGLRRQLPPCARRLTARAGGQRQRARVRLSPRGRRLAALLGRPPGIRIRQSRHAVPGREDWAEAWVRMEPAGLAVLDMLALGPEAEVMHPPELRAAVREAAIRIAALHASPAEPR